MWQDKPTQEIIKIAIFYVFCFPMKWVSFQAYLIYVYLECVNSLFSFSNSANALTTKDTSEKNSPKNIIHNSTKRAKLSLDCYYHLSHLLAIFYGRGWPSMSFQFMSFILMSTKPDTTNEETTNFELNYKTINKIEIKHRLLKLFIKLRQRHFVLICTVYFVLWAIVLSAIKINGNAQWEVQWECSMGKFNVICEENTSSDKQHPKLLLYYVLS